MIVLKWLVQQFVTSLVSMLTVVSMMSMTRVLTRALLALTVSWVKTLCLARLLFRTQLLARGGVPASLSPMLVGLPGARNGLIMLNVMILVRKMR